MSPAPSYYDSIGLLAICDAIDAVEGIPFHPVAKIRPLPSFNNSTAITSVPVPSEQVTANVGKNAIPQHILLAHIPVAGVFSPFGTLSYDEQHRMAINQLASTGQLPQQAPAHTIGGVRPNIPVAHNLHGASGQRSRSTSMPQSPGNMGRLASPSVSQLAHVGPGMPGPGMANKPVTRPHVPPPQALSQQQLSRSESPALPLPGPMMNSPGLTPQMQGSLGGPQTVLPPSQGFGGMPHARPAPAPVATESRASTPGSPLESSQTQYRVEVCQICGRDFKGRKAATHKQQHIRRLHPAEYTPKRGGKKSRVD